MSLSRKKYILLLSLIFISLFNKSNQNEQKKKERIENTIKLILSSMIGITNTTSFTFKYKKYKIIFSNFKLIKPLIQNIKIIQKKNDKNELLFIINNFNIAYNLDLNISLCSNSNINLQDKSRFVEANFGEIKFKLISDYYIELDSSYINSINFFTNNILGNLDFFSDFKNGQSCMFYEDNQNPIKIDNLNDTYKLIFNKLFNEKIKETEKNVNLLTYDLIQIFNSATEKLEAQNLNFIEYFQVTKFFTKSNEIIINKENNTIQIKNILIIGKYFSSTLDNINFNYTCVNKYKNDNKIFLTFKIIPKNKNYIEIGINSCEYNNDFNSQLPDSTDDLDNLIKNILVNYLNKKVDYYYNNIFN